MLGKEKRAVNVHIINASGAWNKDDGGGEVFFQFGFQPGSPGQVVSL